MPLYGAEQAKLLKLRKADDKNSIQIYFSLNKTPDYTTKVKGKRVDIIIKEHVAFDESFVFPTDDKIIKFLYLPRANKTVFTFFMRFNPQKVKLLSPSKNSLVLDILLGNAFTKEYPALSSKLKGITIVSQKTKDFANPYVASPYSNNWRSFFTSYESKLKTYAPITYTLPEFPIIALLPPGIEKNRSLIPQELTELARQNLWEDMQPLTLELINSEQNVEVKKMLVLTLGEILLRAGNFSGSFKQLYLLNNKYKGEQIAVFAQYLLVRLRAEHENPYIADFEFRSMDSHIDNDNPIAPFFVLAKIETALATHQYERMKTLLARDDISYPGKTSKIRDLRQADYWYSINDLIKAYVGYNLLKRSHFLRQHPYSLNGYCDTLYRQKQYSNAASCYQALGGGIEDKEQLSMISFRRAMSELHSKRLSDMYPSFSIIENTFPGTEAGFRAALKKTDIQFLTKPNFGEKSARYYHALAKNSTNRTIVEEASLKEAIVFRLMNRLSKSIELLMELQRNFRTGELRTTAQALLIEILPIEIKRLVQEKEFIKALVLAKKNRKLFSNNWIDIRLLSDIGEAYHQLSIYNEAKKLYLYLLEVEEADKKEHFYLPLIKILFSRGEYNLVEDYATQYSYQYPKGTFEHDIFLLRLQALVADGKKVQALDLLTQPLPDMPELKEFAADIYFLEKNYAKTVEFLAPAIDQQNILTQDAIFILAESYYELGNLDKAKALYLRLNEDNLFFDQTLFRRANIEKKKGREENALKLFQEIVEKGKNPLWQKLAQKELDFKEASDRL